MHLKVLPRKPTRFCIKNTGPFEVNRISIAIIGKSQLKIKRMIKTEPIISTILFQIENVRRWL
jgi:hypothetical protein